MREPRSLHYNPPVSMSKLSIRDLKEVARGDFQTVLSHDGLSLCRQFLMTYARILLRERGF